MPASFKPKTVYVIYIAATPDKVWQALTAPEFTRKYFWDRTIEVEPRARRRVQAPPAGRQRQCARQGLEYDPPRRLSVTWQVALAGRLPQAARMPASLTRSRPPAKRCVCTMTESHSWEVPDTILSGGRMGWPAILSALKSLLETGKALAIKMEPPKRNDRSDQD